MSQPTGEPQGGPPSWQQAPQQPAPPPPPQSWQQAPQQPVPPTPNQPPSWTANLTSTAPGFIPEGVIAVRASVPPIPHAGAAQIAAFQDRLRDAARSVPGVSSAAHAMFIPFAPGTWGDGYRRAGTADSPPQGPMAHFFMVSPDYFEVMGMPIIIGRGLSPSDREGSAPSG